MKDKYKLMYETRNVRPYYTILHLGVFGAHFKKIVGFEYKKPIYITSADMNNQGYHELKEMSKATEYFRKIWRNKDKTKDLISKISGQLIKAQKAENKAWKQNWKELTTKELIKEMNFYYKLLFDTLGEMIISQPQHVLSLEEDMQKCLINYPLGARQNFLTGATAHKGDLPWSQEEKEIKKLHSQWRKMSKENQDAAIDKLVKKYGWFNDIEGDGPFTGKHYRDKILTYKKPSRLSLKINIPKNIKKIGSIIGELGYLRFWNRYHFMTLRYHLENILKELIDRFNNPVFDFATIDEINNFFSGTKVNIQEMGNRKMGYSSRLVNGTTEILTGNRAHNLRKLVSSSYSIVKEITGTIANRGKIRGRVRIISFSAKDYTYQVSAFKQGEILVTGMTRPQIVHLCKKAAAIVTDEGGITSHAAVISREFNIPCIIGTHNATKILKTDDFVEVDAEKGIVKILNK